jgi:hypothetical protein
MKDVVDAVKDVEKKYANCKITCSCLDKIRKFFRKAGSYAESARPWIKCVPHDMYGSALNCAFEAIITVSLGD